MSATKTDKKPTEKQDEERPAVAADPTQCQCTDVVRRWDTDGLIEPGKYRCSVCGKWYA